MRRVVSAWVLVLMCSAAYGDAMGAAAIVLDTPTYARLIERAGAADKVRTDDLMKAARVTTLCAELDSKTFRSGDLEYMLRVAERKDAEGHTTFLYSVSRLSRPKDSQEVFEVLVCVGECTGTNIPKAGWRKDPFVVLTHYGNYLMK